MNKRVKKSQLFLFQALVDLFTVAVKVVCYSPEGFRHKNLANPGLNSTKDPTSATLLKHPLFVKYAHRLPGTLSQGT